MNASNTCEPFGKGSKVHLKTLCKRLICIRSIHGLKLFPVIKESQNNAANLSITSIIAGSKSSSVVT
jgi:hypothetical protein